MKLNKMTYKMKKNKNFNLIKATLIFFSGLLFSLPAIATSEIFTKFNFNVEFIDNGCISPVSEFSYKLNKDLKVKVNGLSIIVPEGFVTDLASIPRILWSFDPPFDGKYVLSAILHDYLYTYDIVKSRKLADNIFYVAMLEEGTSKFRALKFYLIVRMFGGSHYGSRKKSE